MDCLPTSIKSLRVTKLGSISTVQKPNNSPWYGARFELINQFELLIGYQELNNSPQRKE